MTESAAFVTSLSSPHEDYSSSKVLTGSSTVFIEGKAAARVGDILGKHVNSKGNMHIPKINKGSSTVFIEGKAAARIGDTTDCGSKLLTGASTVNIG